MRLVVSGLALAALAGCILEESAPERTGPRIVRTYAAHGPNCPAIEEESVDRLVEIAAMAELTTHEQIHLVDAVLDDLAPGYRQGEALAALAANPSLAEDGRTHLSRRMRELVSGEDRAQVAEALSAKR